MNKKFPNPLKYVLAAILLLTVASLHAQTPGNAGDSTMHHRYGMHRWRNEGDSTKRFHRGGAEAFHRGGAGTRGGFHHPGGFDRPNFAHRGFGHNRGFNHGFHREHIRYTPEQRKQVAAINKEYRQKREDLFKQDNLTLKQYKAGLVTLGKEKKSKMAALLTPEQKSEMAASRKRMDENRQVREAAHLERLKLHLNLSDDQLAKLKAGNETLRSQAKAIHENDNLLPQEKMAQLKALIAKRNDTYKSVLTPDQYTQFQTMMSHRRAGGGQFRGSRFI